VEIFAVSSESPAAQRRLRARLGAGYRFLSDPEGRVLDLLNIRHRVANPSGRDIALPTSILVDRDGVVRWIYEAADYRVRARPEEVLVVLDRLQPKAGPSGGR